MKYKGDIKPLSELTLGTPVEIVEESEFRLEGAGLPERIPGIPVTGVLTGWGYARAINTLVPIVRVPGEGSDWPAIYPVKEFNKNSKVLKALTGGKAELLKRQRAALIKTNPKTAFSKWPGFVLGCDPEIFVVDGAGKLIPAWKYLPKKTEALKYGDNVWPNSGMCYMFWDGAQAEFTTQSHKCAALQQDCIRSGLQAIRNKAREFDPTAKLSIRSVIELTPEVLDSAEYEHLAFGCSPSKNAYGLEGQKLSDPRMLTYRFAGGHMHLGHEVMPEILPKMLWMMDAMGAVALTGAFAGYEDPRRRMFYGLPGEYRLPKHGLEYRTLPNTWLCHPAVSLFTWDLIRTAAWLGAQGLDEIWRTDKDEVLRVITESDVTGARAIVERNKDVFACVLNWIRTNSSTSYSYGTPEQYAQAGWKLVMEGLDACLKDPGNFDENWMLDAPLSSTHGDGGWECQAFVYTKQFQSAAVELCKGNKI